MWKEIGLLGRDKVLEKTIRPRLKAKTGFVLAGQHGLGKTALLEWCYEHIDGKKTLISATQTPKEMFTRMCIDWELEILGDDDKPLPRSKWSLPRMYDAILHQSGNSMFIDDIQRITPSALQKIKPLRDRCTIICAGIPPFRKDELKRMLFGLKYIEVEKIGRDAMLRIGEAAAPLVGSSTPVVDAVHAARGIPAHLVHALRGEVTPEAHKVSGEELDISPLILVLFACVMAARYLAMAVDSTTMYLLAGFGMAAGMIVRFYLFRGMNK